MWFQISNRLLADINGYCGELVWWSPIVCFVLVYGILGLKNKYSRDGYRTYKWIVVYAFYYTCVLTITVLGRQIGQAQNGIETILSSYKMIFEGQHEKVLDLLANVIIFVPFGLLHFIEGKGFKQTIFLSFLLSLVIELVQFCTGCGLFEVGDLMSNTIGGVVGAGFGIFIRRIMLCSKTKLY